MSVNNMSIEVGGTEIEAISATHAASLPRGHRSTEASRSGKNPV